MKTDELIAQRLMDIMETDRRATNIESVVQCRVCLNLGDKHVPANGPMNAKVMVVGQSPGAEEVERHQPFVGPCGPLLELMLAEANLEREDVYISNILKCRPPNNRRGKKVELNNCYKIWMKDEIDLVNPDFIVLVGGDAHKTIMPKRFKFEHGAVKTNKKGRTYLTTYHPSYFMRQGNPVGFIEFGKLLGATINEDGRKETTQGA